MKTLLTAADVAGLAVGGQLPVAPGVLLTPGARERAAALGLEIVAAPAVSPASAAAAGAHGCSCAAAPAEPYRSLFEGRMIRGPDPATWQRLFAAPATGPSPAVVRATPAGEPARVLATVRADGRERGSALAALVAAVEAGGGRVVEASYRVDGAGFRAALTAEFRAEAALGGLDSLLRRALPGADVVIRGP